jgi:hypothetical protein
MPRFARYLRIGWTVLCGIACVLLVVLWVRSYWWSDQFNVNAYDFHVGGASVPGIVGVRLELGITPKSWRTSIPVDEMTLLPNSGWYLDVRSDAMELNVPYWFAVLLTATLTAVSWLPWRSTRFSLRTLLLALTVVAVVLGAVMYLAH